MNCRIAKILTICLIGFLTCACRNRDETYAIVISLDAFRWDYQDVMDTPGLDKIASNGIRRTLKPSYPASTFPNHYTIATGLVPDHHGIVNSTFWNPETGITYSMGDSLTRYNPAYYSGEPIWVTAEKAGIKTGCIYWVGSDVATQGILPTYAYPWWEMPHMSFEERADEAVRLLSLPDTERPRLVMLYFDEPDGTSHKYGPLAPETKAMVAHLDSIVYDMVSKIRSLDHGGKVNVMILSDHGMTEISPDRFIDWNEYIRDSWIERIIGTNPTNIYAKENCVDSIMNALTDVAHISAWKRGEVPEELNYGTSNRCGDVIVASDIGWQFADKAKEIVGAHGYFPHEKDMLATFIACGPYFQGKDRLTDSHIDNVDIYSIISDILAIKPVETDGSLPEL